MTILMKMVKTRMILYGCGVEDIVAVEDQNIFPLFRLVLDSLSPKQPPHLYQVWDKYNQK